LERGDKVESTPTKQKAIFSASLLLFAERGFDATTMPMIAENAKVGAGTIYRYFKNKESLVNELFQQHVNEFLQCIESGLANERDGYRDGFHHIFEGMVTFTKNHPRALGFIKTHSQGAFLTEESRLAYQKLVEFVCTFFREGQKQGVIRNLPENALIAILFGSFMEVYEMIENNYLSLTDELLTGVEESLWAALSRQS
jgi:AcrR family transcriptional regulator